jgi:signal transduction histidine kinase
VATTIIAFLSLVAHRYITMYRSELMRLNEKFALIGKQSSYLFHEIKSPLNRVVQRTSQSDRSDLMEEIRDDSLRMSSILLGIETLVSRPEKFSETFEVFQWRDLEGFIYRDFSLLLDSAQIKLNTLGFKGHARGNPYLLFQVMKNLVTNAIEAIQMNRAEAAEITLTLTLEEGRWRIACLNTESQISKAHQKQIFDPLFSTKDSLKNKGLGLTFSKNIVEGHSGQISVHSESNKTLFTFFIPELS